LPVRRVDAREFIADGVTPIAAYRAVTESRPGPSFLLESSPGQSRTSRYSVIGTGCLGEVRAVDGQCTLACGDDVRTFDSRSALDAARELLRACAPHPEFTAGLGRFLGAYGAAAFEFAAYLERLPALACDGDPMPDLHLIVPESVIVFDHFDHHVRIMTLEDHNGHVRDGADLADAIAHATIEPLRSTATNGKPPAAGEPLGFAMPFTEAVRAAQEHIRAGDALQIVLSQGWMVSGCADPFDAYRALRSINPSPYMFYVDFGWGPLFGSSPEVLVRLDERTAVLRPLAGTRARGADAHSDRAIARELKRDEKERAEHVMLVDLGRNDLGRSCAPGSVSVTRLLGVEMFSHVMHLVSEVNGQIREGCDAFDLFAGAYPAGTVSGAPKIRAMELIAELEGRRRGFYAGAVGYFSFDGSMDSCITLRSAHATKGGIAVRAGAGIVADSIPAMEDGECRAKAGVLFDALALVQGGKA
jgi:anthranilate synthase component I